MRTSQRRRGRIGGRSSRVGHAAPRAAGARDSGVCAWTILPSWIRIVRGVRAATSASWVTIKTVMPVWLISDIRSMICGDVVAVERAGRLVGEDHPRLADQRARDRDALLLTARHLGRRVIGPVGEPDALEVLHRLLVAPAPRDALVVERQRDVLHRGLERQQVERLEHEAEEAVAIVRRLALAEILDQRVAEPVLAGVVVVEDAEDVEQRRLAGARRAHDRDHLAFGDLEIDVAQDVQASACRPCRTC